MSTGHTRVGLWMIVSATDKKIFCRRLYFIGGLDPRGPKAIHRIWAEQAPLQAQVSGGTIKVGRLSVQEELRATCTIEFERGQRRAQTEIIQLRWDDLVRRWWRRGIWSVMASVPGSCWRLMRSGVYGLARREARPMFYSLLLPPLVVGLLLALVAGGAGLASVFHPLLSPVVGLVGLGVMARIWGMIDRKVGLNWLTQCLYYMRFGGSRELVERKARAQVFAQYLIDAVDRADVDEVVLVGFSLGANEAFRALGLALDQRPDLGQGRTKLSLVVVGQLCASYGLVGGDHSFASGRQRVAEARAVSVINVTSASDPASGCTLSPLLGVRGVEPDRVINRQPRFHKLLSPKRFAAIRRDPLAFHFQYMHATDVAGDYDWFDLICGPSPLSAPAPRLPRAA